MDSAVKILRYNDEHSHSSDIIKTLKKSLSSLEFHKNTRITDHALSIFCTKLPKWKLTVQEQLDIKFITLTLLAHSCDWVKDAFYVQLNKVIKCVLSGLIKTSENTYDESSLKFFFDPAILLEICCFGLDARSEQVKFLLDGRFDYDISPLDDSIKDLNLHV